MGLFSKGEIVYAVRDITSTGLTVPGGSRGVVAEELPNLPGSMPTYRAMFPLALGRTHEIICDEIDISVDDFWSGYVFSTSTGTLLPDFAWFNAPAETLPNRSASTADCVSECQHELVDVGFAHSKMVCKKCNVEVKT